MRENNRIPFVSLIPFLSLVTLVGAGIINVSYGQVGRSGRCIRAYNDIDVFTLTGVDEIRGKVVYPCIQIEEISDVEKNIHYCSSPTKDMVRNYKRYGEYWLSIYKQVGDTGVERVYEYIRKEKIFKLYYSIEKDDKIRFLKEVYEFEKWRETSFLIAGNLSVTPGIKVPAITKQKAQFFYIQDIIIRNGILSLYTKRVDKKNVLLYKKTLCYEIGNQSYFRWMYLDDKIKIVNCNE